MKNNTIILGAGMTGLAAGSISGFPVYEASALPGGICSSYYIRPGDKTRLHAVPQDGEAYRFDIGGGHWIFGGDAILNQFLNTIAPFKAYNRISSVYFRKTNQYVPYPIQNHLGYLDKAIALKALTEMTTASGGTVVTMEDWMRQSFGDTLTGLFFAPFHEMYTAGLWQTISPQDSYKSPVNLKLALQGAFEKTPPAVGYNTSFLYPIEGLDRLSSRMAEKCNITYNKEVIKIDLKRKEVHFKDGSGEKFERIISTLPLNRTMEMSGLNTSAPVYPYSSVLVLNIGAVRGAACPNDHWLYNPDTQSRFHRVGFYSNVDVSFLPRSSQTNNSRVSIYVERAYPGSALPSQSDIETYAASVVKELQEWGYIGSAEVVDPTWIDVAYTWAMPQSNWKEQATRELQNNHIYPIGRYAAWSFQGIANSIRDGFLIGSCFK
jgi:protoporphyrinogen oxidase